MARLEEDIQALCCDGSTPLQQDRLHVAVVPVVADAGGHGDAPSCLGLVERGDCKLAVSLVQASSASSVAWSHGTRFWFARSATGIKG